ncbi:MAG: protease modulator HflK [Clostridia bacterium]|nr:protease modulator HflK [Clostridia bacterium]
MRTKKKNGVFADILTSVTKYFLILVAIVIAWICLSGIRIVKSGEVAIVLRFGELVGDTYEEQVHEPGLLLAFPYIIDEVVMVPTESVMEVKVTTHYTNGVMTTLRNNGYVLTGDQNVAVVSATVKYVISDPVSYALYVNDMDSLINGFVSSSMLDEAAGISVDDLLTKEKDSYGTAVLNDTQAKLDTVGAGVTITTIELTNVRMPAEVKEIYDLVNSAKVEYSTKLEQAKIYRENLIPSAEAQRNTLISNANAKYSSAVAEANQDLAEFWGLLDEYNTNPDVVTTRIYSAKMAEAIAKIGTVRVVEDEDTKIFIN